PLSRADPVRARWSPADPPAAGCPARTERTPSPVTTRPRAGGAQDALAAPGAEFIREPPRSYPDLPGLGCGVAPALGFAADPPAAACCALSSAALTLARSAWYVPRSPLFSAAWAWL